MFVIPRLFIIENLPYDEKLSWVNFLKDIKNEISVTEYYFIARELGDNYLERYNYSKSMKKVFRKAWRELFIFLEANELNYSYKVAEYWCVKLWKLKKMAPVQFRSHLLTAYIYYFCFCLLDCINSYNMRFFY